MSVKVWRGDQKATAQLNTITPANVNIGNSFTVTINAKAITFTATAATVANVTAGLVALLQASTIPEFQEVTWADATTAITGTAATPGRPFTQTSSASGGTATLTTVVTTANTSPNDWNDAANWSASGVPANADDVYIENTSSSILYGLDQSAVTLTSLNIAQSFTGRIGNPRVNETGLYWEYRDTYLKVSATTLNVGQGTGGGSGRIKVNLGTAQSTINVGGTGQPIEQGIPALLLVGTHASNALNVTQGSVGVAAFSGEAATVATVRVGSEDNPSSDVALTLGAGCTLTTVNIHGGTVVLSSAVTTLFLTFGTATVGGTATVTTLNNQGGLVNYESSGTITTLTVGSGATLDFDRDPRARTVTNCTLSAGATLKNYRKTVTVTNGYVLNDCGLADVKLDVGEDVTLEVT